jgi:hypothetical protein
LARRRGRLSRESILYLSSSPRLLREDRPRGGNNRGGKSVSDIFELSFRWQDGAVQVIIYALVIYLGLVIISKISDKRKRER